MKTFMSAPERRFHVESAGAEPRNVQVGQMSRLRGIFGMRVLNLGAVDCVCIQILSGVDIIGEIGFEPYDGRAS